MEVFNYAYDAVTQCGEPVSPRGSSWRGKRDQLLQKATGQDLKLILKISSLLDKKVLKSESDIVMTSQEQIEEDLNSEDSQLDTNEDIQRERRMSTQSGDSVDGTYYLTDEERETFLAEGLPLPNVVPFTKAEERTLKRIRRKIKNKISAQESRRKKKEYVEGLEKRMRQSNAENSALQEKVDTLEHTGFAVRIKPTETPDSTNKERVASTRPQQRHADGHVSEVYVAKEFHQQRTSSNDGRHL